MIESQEDFIAQLYYRTTEEGGRAVPAYSGYRPGIEFSFCKMQTSGRQTFIDKESAYPGETVKASIKIISVDFFADKLIEGMDFEFKEGNIVIGTGKILTILNARLKKASS